MREKMQKIIPDSLLRLAKACPKPLYVVGGTVRDALSDLVLQKNSPRDWDICSPLPYEAFSQIAIAEGFAIKSVFKNTGTVKLQDETGVDYEFSCFRSDRYVRGTHVPVEIYFTEDITLDARRRDFTVNAVYYDVAKSEFVDPLNGISAIHEKRLTTVAPAEKVFGEDGLRLLRLARQSAQLGFRPDEECLNGAKSNAALIRDISPERILAELNALLTADLKYGVKDGHYFGLKLLDETRVLDYVLPELTLGRNLAQRADFHKYDVLEHSLRAAKYAPPNLRLAALLHDVGKPFCKYRDGNSYAHPEEGERLAKEILSRLKAPNKYIERIPALVKWHMYDFNCQTSEKKLRRFFIEHYDILDDLLFLKQADFSACTDDLNVAPTCARWTELLTCMKAEKTPFTLKELAVTGKDILMLGIPPKHVSNILRELLLHTANFPADNQKERLLRLAQGIIKGIR